MSAGPATRVNYFERQFIRLNELRDEQAYHVDLRRRHNLSHHAWGIVLGLEIVQEQDGRPVVRPGFAVDGYGRELFLLERKVVGREEFDRRDTSRLDLWLEYRLELAEDRLAPRECADGDPRAPYRAKERAEVTLERGGARPNPRRPPGVPSEALEEPLLATTDAPRQRWPVYLGRITMDLPASGIPAFYIETDDRVYAGLNAEIIDHPGSAARLELGARPTDDTRILGDERFTYAGGSKRDFAVFVPPTSDWNGSTLEPTIAVEPEGTQIRGAVKVHGNLILDGAGLQFPDNSGTQTPGTDGQPALYRTLDELRIDLGSLDAANRRLVLGVTKDGKFVPALEIGSTGTGATAHFLVTVKGDLRIEGTISSPDVRTRTVTEEVAALLTGMLQAGMAAGG